MYKYNIHVVRNIVLFLLIIFYYSTIFAQSPTYATEPKPENILVVYNSQSDTSFQIMNYYKNARGIPGSNIVGLPDLDTLANIIDLETGIEHLIELQQGEGNEKEIIYDTQGRFDTVYKHAWIYFIDRIAEPIAYHLRTTVVNGDTLKNTIRFIVLCKGVPFKIQAAGDWSVPGNINVDALLCMLNTGLIMSINERKCLI